MSLNTEHLQSCITTLRSAIEKLKASVPDTIDYDIFRNAGIKGFELTLETAGKLLRKTLKLYTPNPRAIDALTYKDLLREAGKHGILSSDEIARWFVYRDNNVPDYDQNFAEETLTLIPGFLDDAESLQKILHDKLSAQSCASK